MWAVVQFWPSGGHSPSSAPSTTTEPSSTPSATPVADGTVDIELTHDSQACDPEDVIISPSVPSDQHAGHDVDIQFSLSNTADEACLFDPKKAELLTVISSNKKAVWDSTVCKSALLDKKVPLAAEFATVVDATWSGRGSGSDCDEKNNFAGSGDYVLKVATLGGEPGKASFELKDKPKKKDSEKKDSDTKDSKKKDSKKKDSSQSHDD